MKSTHLLFDWGNTLMVDLPGQAGPMAFWPRIECVPEALETLSLLSTRIPCHLATNAKDSTEKDIELALQRAGLRQFLSQLFCFRKLNVEKPNPAFFSAIQEHLQAEPSQLIMVGDSLDKDVLGAIQAGWNAIWLNPNNESAPVGIRSISRLKELCEIFPA